MPFVTADDGAQIFYKDWGIEGSPVLLSHGWPLNADAWDAAALFLATHGHRVVAHDRRGHGRSSQTWHGNEMDTYADDLATLLNTLDLTDVTLVGHSTGGGETVRYLGRHGSSRIAKLVLVSAVPPFMLHTGDNPDGLPVEIFDDIRTGELSDRSQLYRDFADGPSSGTTAAAMCRRAFGTHSGCRAWRVAIAQPTSVLPPSRPPTFARISTPSTCPRW